MIIGDMDGRTPRAIAGVIKPVPEISRGKAWFRGPKYLGLGTKAETTPGFFYKTKQISFVKHRFPEPVPVLFTKRKCRFQEGIPSFLPKA